jgi:pSer/pThr/pTyr-binding forkhead associated (FHA) protein
MSADEIDHTRVNRDRREMPAPRLPPGVRGKLVWKAGSEEGRVEYLETPFATLGRHPDNTICVDDNAASGKHALICFVQSMEWRIVDEGSTNGTLLNGSPVKEYALRDGDKILIGDTMMVFHVERG